MSYGPPRTYSAEDVRRILRHEDHPALSNRRTNGPRRGMGPHELLTRIVTEMKAKGYEFTYDIEPALSPEQVES